MVLHVRILFGTISSVAPIQFQIEDSSLNNRDRTEVLLEDMNGKFDAIMEYVRDIPVIKNRLERVENRLERVESRLDHVEIRLTGVEDEQRLTRVAIIEELHDVEALKRLHPNMSHP
jgi:archaellum component FlaC